METLNHNQSATDLIGDINANLQEMSSQVVVAVTDSAESLVSELNTAFTNVDGKIVLSKDMDAETFVGNVNANFEAAVQDDSGEDDTYVFPTYNSAKYGSEMSDTINKVSTLSADSDLIYLISTDQHYDNRSDSNYALLNPNYAWGSTVPNMREFIRLADAGNIDVDAIALLGDFTDGHYTDSGTETGQERCINYVKQNMSIALVSRGKVRTGMKPLIYAVGNHDNNVDSGPYPRLYDDDLCDLYIKDCVGIDDADNVYVFNNNIFSNYPVLNSDAHKSTIHPDYYIDYPTKKLRVIVLYCDDETDNIGKNWQIAPITRMWLAAMFGQDVNGNTLTASDEGYGLEMPQDYKAVILCHIHPLNHGGTRVAAEKIINRNKSRILIYICGHSHCDNVTLISAAGTVNQPNGQQVISMRLASGRAENAGVGQHLGYVVPSRSKNDYTTDLWSVFALSKDRAVAHFIRFGAGFDHHVHLHNQEWQRGGSLALSPSALAGKQVTWYVQPLPEFSAEYNSTSSLTSHIIPANINGGVLTINEDTPDGDVYFVAYCVYNEGLSTEEREFWGIHLQASAS